jgi:CRP-like cAMP-binding protein
VRRGADKKIEALQGVWLFSTCSKKELRLLAGICDRVSVPAGERVVKEGEPGREFYVILDGAAEATAGTAVIARLGAGDFFGEMALLDGGPRSASVTTTDESDLLILTRGSFMALLTEDAPSVAPKMLAVLGARLREAGAQLVAARSNLGSI